MKQNKLHEQKDIKNFFYFTLTDMKDNKQNRLINNNTKQIEF